jgi:hypothetical protein
MAQRPAHIFLPEPKRSAGGKLYQGRFTCHDIQWTGRGSSLFGTFTITAGELADAASSGLLWTDQDVQRGIKPDRPTNVRELSLATGYPDTNVYIFDAENADDIVDKLLHDKQLFLSPLIWNLRPGDFLAYRDDVAGSLYIYDGRIYLPDSHHRQQAIIKAVKLFRDSPDDYPGFSDEKQFKVELYFLPRENEGDYFFDKNQRPKPTAKSKAYDLTTEDDLSILAKSVILNSGVLRGNVNRVTDRLTAKNSDLLTLSTLREMMKTFAGSEVIGQSELEGMATVAGSFFDMLADVRPELSKLDAAARVQVRANSLVDSATIMHGYAALMRSYNLDMARMGAGPARERWHDRLARLSSSVVYKLDDWQGEFFDRANPLWERAGILKRNRNGDYNITNSGATRAEAGRILRTLMAVDQPVTDLAFVLAR